jgi:hypothetical protein
MADYTVTLFHEDFGNVMPIMLKYQNLATLNESEPDVKPGDAVLEIISYFISKYGNARGTDYEMRFLSVMQFIEHYQNDLIKSGLISVPDSKTASVPNSILEILLESIRPPQPPSRYPSSPLFNQEHEFNYKKVIKALKTKNK